MSELSESMVRFPDDDVLVSTRSDEPLQSREPRSASRHLSEDTYRRLVGRAVLGEIRATLRSLRDSALPTTVCHALLYRDAQSVAELEARLGRESSEILTTLAALEYVDLVAAADDFGVRRYSLTPPTGTFD